MSVAQKEIPTELMLRRFCAFFCPRRTECIIHKKNFSKWDEEKRWCNTLNNVYGLKKKKKNYDITIGVFREKKHILHHNILITV